MSFIRVNGLALPAADKSPRTSPKDIGSRQRAFSGGLLTDRRARKRTWTLRTAPVTELVAKAIEGAVAGLGDVLPFNYSDADRLVQDFFTSKGSGPGATVGSIRFGTGVDGAPTVSEGFLRPESKYGSGAGTVEFGTENILTADQRDVEGSIAGNFSTVAGGVLALETATVLQGTQSLKVTSASGGDGVETDAVPASSSTAYTGSVYCRIASGTASIRFRLVDDDVGTVVLKSETIGVDWQRVEFSGTTGGAATEIRIEITDNVTGQVWFADAFQIELGIFATTWADPTRAAGDLAYPVSIIKGATDLTVNSWVRGLDDSGEARRILINARNAVTGATDNFKITRQTSSDLRVNFITKADDVADNINAVSIFDGTWKMITAVLRANPESGEDVKSLYVDGVLISTSNPAVPALSEFVIMEIGHENGVNRWGSDSAFDDMQILPFAATTAQILAWFNMGKAMPQVPRVYIDGDIMPENELTVRAEGSVQSSFLAANAATGFRNNLRQLDITLLEV